MCLYSWVTNFVVVLSLESEPLLADCHTGVLSQIYPDMTAFLRAATQISLWDIQTVIHILPMLNTFYFSSIYPGSKLNDSTFMLVELRWMNWYEMSLWSNTVIKWASYLHFQDTTTTPPKKDQQANPVLTAASAPTFHLLLWILRAFNICCMFPSIPIGLLWFVFSHRKPELSGPFPSNNNLIYYTLFYL